MYNQNNRGEDLLTLERTDIGKTVEIETVEISAGTEKTDYNRERRDREYSKDRSDRYRRDSRDRFQRGFSKDRRDRNYSRDRYQSRDYSRDSRNGSVRDYSRDRNRRDNSKDREEFKGKCFKCNNPGHRAIDCGANVMYAVMPQNMPHESGNHF
jgi:hypothetical protein